MGHTFLTFNNVTTNFFVLRTHTQIHRHIHTDRHTHTWYIYSQSLNFLVVKFC